MITESKLLLVVLDVLTEESYAEELYAYTLTALVEAIQNYYNNIKEIVPLLLRKLNEILAAIRRKTDNYLERFSISLLKHEQQQHSDSSPFEDSEKDVLCYLIVNASKMLEKIGCGLESQYGDMKNEFASETLLNYLELLQFPFLFLTPHRNTHKTPFFAVKTTVKALCAKIDPSEISLMMTKALDKSVHKIECLMGVTLDKPVKSLNLELIVDISNKDLSRDLKSSAASKDFYR